MVIPFINNKSLCFGSLQGIMTREHFRDQSYKVPREIADLKKLVTYVRFNQEEGDQRSQSFPVEPRLGEPRYLVSAHGFQSDRFNNLTLGEEGAFLRKRDDNLDLATITPLSATGSNARLSDFSGSRVQPDSSYLTINEDTALEPEPGDDVWILTYDRQEQRRSCIPAKYEIGSQPCTTSQSITGELSDKGRDATYGRISSEVIKNAKANARGFSCSAVVNQDGLVVGAIKSAHAEKDGAGNWISTGKFNITDSESLNRHILSQ